MTFKDSYILREIYDNYHRINYFELYEYDSFFLKGRTLKRYIGKINLIKASSGDMVEVEMNGRGNVYVQENFWNILACFDKWQHNIKICTQHISKVTVNCKKDTVSIFFKKQYRNYYPWKKIVFYFEPSCSTLKSLKNLKIC